MLKERSKKRRGPGSHSNRNDFLPYSRQGVAPFGGSQGLMIRSHFTGDILRAARVLDEGAVPVTIPVSRSPRRFRITAPQPRSHVPVFTATTMTFRLDR